MRTLPDFQKNVMELHEDGLQLFNATNETYAHLKRMFNERWQECKSESESYGPKIMFFGTYNAGKSTLLNAFIGKEVAATADIPKTYEVDSYEWNGYKIWDTPGINAPIEHEEVALAKLKDCDIIVFVVSAEGAFEDKKIYEQMINILSTGKDLLIVLNNKSNLDPSDPQLEVIKLKIEDNLRKFSGDANVGKKVQYMMVNAKDAFDGRIEQEDDLVVESNILSLEELILIKLKGLNKFEPLCRVLSNFQVSVKQSIDELDAVASGDSHKESASRKIHKACYDTVEIMRNKVATECASLGRNLFSLFPSPDNAKTVEQSAFNELITLKIQEYVDAVQKIWEKEAYNLKEQLDEYITDAKEQSVHDVNISHDGGVEIPAAPEDFVMPTSEALPSMKESSADDVGALLGGVGALLPTIVRIPLTTISLPVTALISIATIAYKLFFGGSSKDDEQRERIEAEVQARNEAEERRNRAIELWRKEARENCNLHASSVTRKLQDAIQERIQTYTAPFLDDAKRYEQQEDKKKKEATVLRDFCYKLDERAFSLIKEMK